MTPDINRSAKMGGGHGQLNKTMHLGDKNRIVVKAGSKQIEIGIPVKITA